MFCVKGMTENALAYHELSKALIRDIERITKVIIGRITAKNL